MDIIKFSHDKKKLSRLFKERSTNPCSISPSKKQKIHASSPQRYFVISPMIPKHLFVMRSSNKMLKPSPFKCVKAYIEEKKKIELCHRSDSSSFFKPLKSKLINFLSPGLFNNCRRIESQNIKKLLPPLCREDNASCILMPKRQMINHNSRTPQPIIKHSYE